MALEPIDLDAEIVPGRSLGGIALGDDALERIVALERDARIAQRPALNPRFTCFQIDESVLLVVGNDDFRIANLAALAGYRGRLFGYVHAGMALGELVARAPSALLREIHLRNEFLYLDRAESVGFLLPPDYDDAADRIEQLPQALVLPALYVMPPAMQRVKGRDGRPLWRPID